MFSPLSRRRPKAHHKNRVADARLNRETNNQLFEHPFVFVQTYDGLFLRHQSKYRVNHNRLTFLVDHFHSHDTTPCGTLPSRGAFGVLVLQVSLA